MRARDYSFSPGRPPLERMTVMYFRRAHAVCSVFHVTETILAPEEQRPKQSLQHYTSMLHFEPFFCFHQTKSTSIICMKKSLMQLVFNIMCNYKIIFKIL